MKKATIFNIHKQVTQWHEQGNAQAYFLKGRIADFYKENKIPLDTLIEDLNKIKKLYFQFDGDLIKKDEAGTELFLDGMTAHSFNMNVQTLMAQNVGTRFVHEVFPEPVKEETPTT
jgi:hypothetical protein